MTQKKYLIIGGGLAGSCVAVHLIRKGEQVCVIDSGVNNSSRVAAGQINPIVFRRMTKSWRVDELYPYAEHFYWSLETEAGNIFVPQVIRRFFSSELEREQWTERQEDPDFTRYIDPINPADQDFPYAKNPFGTATIHTSAFVRAENFLIRAKEIVSAANEWITGELDWSALDPGKAAYKGQEYEMIIFCTGYRHLENPLFTQFRIQQTKGEILTVRAESVPSHEALNRKCFMLPLKDGHFRVGSNYKWDDASLEPTEEAREHILANAEQLLNVPFEVTGQVAGVRPTTTNRRPVIEMHPEFEKLAMFNGLGSKGYMLAPLLAKEFTDRILSAGNNSSPEDF